MLWQGPALVLLAAVLWWTGQALADQTVFAVKVAQAPIVDGSHNDPAWRGVPAVVTRDGVENTKISIKSVYTDEEIFFLVEFSDATENRAHKTLLWNKDLEVYRSGPAREDSFVFKWSMEPQPVDLTISADVAYRADIWYWKAGRTDHAGYADDKMHVYSDQRLEDAKKLYSKQGRIFYLERPSDEGKSSYKTIVYDDFLGDEVPRYRPRTPQGSRADVRAKGVWHDGAWRIEFRRRLTTQNADDVPFETALSYRFGVSLREIAGSEPNPRLEQPNYESGEIGEHLTLVFQK